MYCTNCGEQNQDKRDFCKKCGKKLKTVVSSRDSSPRLASTDTPATPTEWEYRDFVYPFINGRPWVSIGQGGYTIKSAKLWFWHEYQQNIMPILQDWIDQGWQPISDVGAGGMQVRKFRAMRFSRFGWAIQFILILLTASLWLIIMFFMQEDYAEPIEFRVKMRRPKRVTNKSLQHNVDAVIAED